MRKPLLWVSCFLALAAALPAQADNLSVRGALYYGTYQIRGYADPVFFNGFTDSAKTEGMGAGINYGLGRAFIDLGLDYFQVNDGLFGGTTGFDFERTDLALSGGVKIIDWLGVFGGIRHAWQATSNNELVDHPFTSHNGWSENGIFLGPSVGPFGLGPIRVSASVAYNLNRVHGTLSNTVFSTNDDPRQYNGIGAKLRFGLGRSPHAVEVRYQRFANDKPDELDYNEQYLYVGYIFNWNLMHN